MPLSIFWGKSRTRAFSKMAAIGSGQHQFSFMELFRQNRSIWNNSGMGITFLIFFLTFNIFLTNNSRWRPQITKFRSKFNIFILWGYITAAILNFMVKNMFKVKINVNKSTLDNSPPPLLNLKLLRPQGQIIDEKKSL